MRHLREPAWHRRQRKQRQVARFKLWQARKQPTRHKTLVKALDKLELHHSRPQYSRGLLKQTRSADEGCSHMPWICHCGAANQSNHRWCNYCGYGSYSAGQTHWEANTPRRSASKSWSRQRSQSRTRKGHKGSKGKGTHKGKEAVKKEKMPHG